MRRQALPTKAPFRLIFAAAIACHSAATYFSLLIDGKLNLSFYNASSLIFLVIAISSFFALYRRQAIESLIVILLPCTVLSIGLDHWAHSSTDKFIIGAGLISHVILSLLAYSIITVAALQAVALAIQDRQLRQHNFHGLFSYLPPLQTMESLLFDMIWLGFILLSAAIASGFYFLNDMFAQHLAHKTLLSIIAWLVFATLLTGHYRYGWRGQTAAKLTIAGFTALMLAYFGSKFVLELILSP
jgi:ABC-type uncharacterized transport system permease subunit